MAPNTRWGTILPMEFILIGNLGKNNFSSSRAQEIDNHFACLQESAQKDVERAFGVLQARFAIIKSPAQGGCQNQINNIMKACIILHNMISKDELGFELEEWYPGGLQAEHFPNNEALTHHVAHLRNIRSATAHQSLKIDLIEHLWAHKGNSFDDRTL
ncbi:hypothetical protein O181_051086 [Austropuccinia psidii MF-1]|uniref:DDE Tnp4 domain-containing protein n=1 Tax=Austropuccinia psidii MF-1 TaxID=1389203 RepID=A0A9Q3E316_9BASI|nr:hypothetical protein [Austropuccinia psidii MF-1]